jgi:hypothetical protein
MCTYILPVCLGDGAPLSAYLAGMSRGWELYHVNVLPICPGDGELPLVKNFP